MNDRIANPWGEAWPVRVDRFFEEGVSENEVDRWTQTASLHHASGDAMNLGVEDGSLVGMRGRAADRFNRRRLDPKDLFVWQAFDSVGS